MNLDIWYIVIVFAIILVSMTLHEAMHAFMSHWLGDDTAKLQGRLTLNPVAHIDPFLTIGLPLLLVVTSIITQTSVPIFGGAKPVPFNPERVKYGDFGAALVGLSGPFTNLLIAFIAFGFVALLGGSHSGLEGIFAVVINVNLGFFIFNMLPIPPLDGSRALYALAPDSIRRVMEVVEQYGIMVIFGLILLFGSQFTQLIVGLRNMLLLAFNAIFGGAVL